MRVKIDPLDKLFSEFIRKRAMSRVHGCERCLSWKADYKQLQCAHLTGRWKKSTRWDEDNAIGACGGCHMVLDRDHTAKEDFILSHLGQEGYDLLKARARTPARYLDKAAIRLYFRERIRIMEEDKDE